MSEEKNMGANMRSEVPADNELVLCVRASPGMPAVIPGDSTYYYEQLTALSDRLLRKGIRDLPETLAHRIQFLTGDVPPARGRTMILVEPGFLARPTSAKANGDAAWYDERMRFVVSILNGDGRLLRQDSISIALKNRKEGRYVHRMEMEVEAAMERFLIRNIMDRRIRPLLEETLVTGRGVSAFA